MQTRFLSIVFLCFCFFLPLHGSLSQRNIHGQRRSAPAILASQSIPFHLAKPNAPNLDFECWLTLDMNRGAAIVEMIAPKDTWMAVVLGNDKMRGSLAYVFAQRPDTKEKRFELMKWKLGSSNGTTLNEKRGRWLSDDPITTWSATTRGKYTRVLFQRPFRVPGRVEYDFSIYRDNLKYAIARGNTPAFNSYHGKARFGFWIGLRMMRPKPLTTPRPKTTSPTKRPTTTEKPSMSPTMIQTTEAIKVREKRVQNHEQEVLQNLKRMEKELHDKKSSLGNECETDAVFVVDTSVLQSAESCRAKKAWIQKVVTHRKASNLQYQIITYNGCDTRIRKDWNDNKMEEDFCANSKQLEDKLCDSCKDGFALAMQSLDTRGKSLHSTGRRQVLVMITTSECMSGVCGSFGSPSLTARSDRPTVLAFYVGKNKRLYRQLACVSDMSVNFPNMEVFTHDRIVSKARFDICKKREGSGKVLGGVPHAEIKGAAMAEIERGLHEHQRRKKFEDGMMNQNKLDKFMHEQPNKGFFDKVYNRQEGFERNRFGNPNPLSGGRGQPKKTSTQKMGYYNRGIKHFAGMQPKNFNPEGQRPKGFGSHVHKYLDKRMKEQEKRTFAPQYGTPTMVKRKQPQSGIHAGSAFDIVNKPGYLLGMTDSERYVFKQSPIEKKWMGMSKSEKSMFIHGEKAHSPDGVPKKPFYPKTGGNTQAPNQKHKMDFYR